MYITRIDHCDLNQIAESGQCFRWQRIGDNAYRIPAFGRTVEISQKKDQFIFSCEEEEFCKVWKSYFDLDTDYAELIGKIDSEDQFLYKSAIYGGGIRILRQDLWEVMLSFIISQNNNIPRIRKSIEALCHKYKAQSENSAGTGCYPIPDMAQILSRGKEALKDKELSLGYRYEYIWELCELLASQPSFMPKLKETDYTEALQLLMERKGVGKKVASCICLFGLHQLDACPVDTWVRKIIDENYNGNMPDWMKSSYAGVYQQYAFYYKRRQPAA